MTTTLGTTYSTVKEALIDLLRDRPELGTVAVTYEAPLQPDQVVGPTGEHEAIFFVDSDPDEGTQENEVICSLPLRISESYALPLVVQVLRPESDGSQLAADRRVDELLGVVLTVVANNPTLGVDAPFEYLHATRGNFTRRTGVIGSGSGHGSSVRFELHVEARLSYLEV